MENRRADVAVFTMEVVPEYWLQGLCLEYKTVGNLMPVSDGVPVYGSGIRNSEQKLHALKTPSQLQQ